MGFADSFNNIRYRPPSPRTVLVNKVSSLNTNRASQILSSIDHTLLPNSPYEEALNTPPFIEVLNQKGNELRSYISTEYGENLSQFSNSDMILIGLILIPFEERDFQRLSNGQAFSCLMGAIGAVLGIGSLVREFSAAWSGGLTARSLISIIGRMAGTYLAWFMVGWAVKEFGECVGWW